MDPGVAAEQVHTMLDMAFQPTTTDIFTEPDADPNTLANLGPLSVLAGGWTGTVGADVHPVAASTNVVGSAAEGTEVSGYDEHYVLEPIDPQTNGPQLLYGLRYHTRLVEFGHDETFHDQVGYWLWEPATQTVFHTIAIPRGQVVLASGTAAPDATSFTVTAERGSTLDGICSNPFIEENYRTTRFAVTVTIRDHDTWVYDETTTLDVADREEPFLHTDSHVMRRVAAATPNPLWSIEQSRRVDAARPPA